MFRAGQRRRRPEAAGVRKRVQHPASCGEFADRPAGIPLVEIKAALLPVAHIHRELRTVFGDDEGIRRLRAGQQPASLRQSLLRPDADVGAFVDPLCPGRRLQRGDDLGAEAFDACAQELDDQIFAVAVDDQSGQRVALGMDQAAAAFRRIEPEKFPVLDRIFDPAAEERRVDRLLRVETLDPRRELRLRRPGRPGEEAAFRIGYDDGFAGGRFSFQRGDGSREDPDMTAEQRFLAPGQQHKHRFFHNGSPFI